MSRRRKKHKTAQWFACRDFALFAWLFAIGGSKADTVLYTAYTLHCHKSAFNDGV